MNYPIRIAGPEDAPFVHAVYAPIVRDSHASFEIRVPSVDEMRLTIAETLATYPWLIALCDGVHAGYAYARSFRPRWGYRWTTEVSLYVAPEHQRRGVGRALYAALLRCLEVQGFVAAVAVIALPNPGSVRLHEQFGFSPVGVIPQAGFKLGSWYDVSWWRRALRQPDGEPAEPRRLNEMSEELATLGISR